MSVVEACCEDQQECEPETERAGAAYLRDIVAEACAFGEGDERPIKESSSPTEDQAEAQRSMGEELCGEIAEEEDTEGEGGVATAHGRDHRGDESPLVA